MNNWYAGFILAVALICVSNNAMAGTIDYGNAPYPYEEASNVKGVWQQLGNANGTDDGVTWSVLTEDRLGAMAR